MVRRKSGPAGDGGIFGQYVNDRPYVASSFLSVAISEVFGTAMTGRSKDRPELAMTAMPLEAHIPVLPSRGGEPLIRQLFEPLGYSVELARIPLDAEFPEWGPSRYYSSPSVVLARFKICTTAEQRKSQQRYEQVWMAG
jgi:hypothetical protein